LLRLSRRISPRWACLTRIGSSVPRRCWLMVAYLYAQIGARIHLVVRGLLLHDLRHGVAETRRRSETSKKNQTADVLQLTRAHKERSSIEVGMHIDSMY
jgi:hypothetical protein